MSGRPAGVATRSKCRISKLPPIACAIGFASDRRLVRRVVRFVVRLERPAVDCGEHQHREEEEHRILALVLWLGLGGRGLLGLGASLGLLLDLDFGRAELCVPGRDAVVLSRARGWVKGKSCWIEHVPRTERQQAGGRGKLLTTRSDAASTLLGLAGQGSGSGWGFCRCGPIEEAWHLAGGVVFEWPHIARGGGVAEGGLRPPNRHRAPTEG